MRINKYIAQSGIVSRRKADELVLSGRVKVNGKVVTMLGFEIRVKDKVTVDDKLIKADNFQYYKFYKPTGCITTKDDEKGRKTIYDYLPPELQSLKPVGRLDKDTEGLLLITNDGLLAHQLLSPKKHVKKTYFVRVENPVSPEDIKILEEGVDIGEEKRTLPAEISCLSPGKNSLCLTIKEGKFHQIKRMFQAVDNKVLYLKRLSMGSLTLDETLAPGEYRPLTKEEIKRLKDHAGKQESSNI